MNPSAPTTRPQIGGRRIVDTSRLIWQGESNAAASAAHLVYELLVGIWGPGLVEAAFDLGVFGVMSDGPKASDETAARLGLNPRATAVLLDGLASYGLLTTVDGSPQLYAVADAVAGVLQPGAPFSLAGKIRYDRRLAWRVLLARRA